MKTVKALFTKYKFIGVVIFFSLFAVFDLANYGIPPTHDAEYHVLRFQQFYKVLSEGNLYPRWAPDFNNGFGIPLFNYVYPLPNYIGSFFHFLGFGFIDAFKLNMAAGTVVGAVFMYLWSRRYWGEWGGVVSAVFYTFSPYHFVDIYVRGSVGEVLALGIFPGILWAYDGFMRTRKYKYFITAAVLLAGLIYAHNILALLFFTFFLFYAGYFIVQSKKLQDLKDTAFIIFAGFGLAAPFWVPAISETRYVQGLQVFDIASQFPKIYKFFVPTWGFGLSPADPLNPMSVQIGYANLSAIILTILLVIARRAKQIQVFFLASFFLSFFLMTPYSVWIWENIPLFEYFQFPWRLLSLVIFICSFLAGSLISVAKNKKHKMFAGIVLLFLSIGLSLHYMRAPFYHERQDAHYLSRANFTDGTNSPGNAFNTIWLGSIPSKEKVRAVIIRGEGYVQQQVDEKVTSYQVLVDAKTNMEVIFHLAYFPGWTAEIDGIRSKVVNHDGKILINVPPGVHSVRVWLDNTPIQKVAYVYFLTSVLFIISLRPGFNARPRKK